MSSKILALHASLHQAWKQNQLQEVIQQWAKQLVQDLKDHHHHHPLIHDHLSQLNHDITHFNFDPNSKLSGIFYGLKDNLVTKDHVTTGGSRFLSDYVSPFDATVYQLLKNQGAINIGKTNLDEFGLGGTGTFSAYGIVTNPLNHNHIIGGSSSGSAYVVAANIVPFSIGTDTGDSIRKPASFTGIVGFKPSYGLISRYGVYPFSPSLDTVGIFATSVIDVTIVLNALAHQDDNDCTTWHNFHHDYHAHLATKNQFKVAVFADLFDHPTDLEPEVFHHEAVKENFEILLHKLNQHNQIQVETVVFNKQLLQTINAMYMVSAYAEAASCYSNLTGMTFGPAITTNNVFAGFQANRSLLGEEFIKRMVIGSYVLNPQNYQTIYLKSKSIRQELQKIVHDLFLQYDAVILPGAFGTAPSFEQFNKQMIHPANNIDNTLQIANFCGLPSITIPWMKFADNLTVGLNLFADFKKDEKVLQLAHLIEAILEEEKETWIIK